MPDHTPSGHLSDLMGTIHEIAKSGVRAHQLRFADETLVEARAELHVALIQRCPTDDDIIMEHIEKAKALIDYALKQVRAAR